MEYEPVLIDSKTLAERISMSVKFIEKNRNRIDGAQKIGRVWRFNWPTIMARITTGRDIIVEKGQK
ncbi:MAG: hypothetical protein GX640_01885 [Fibrobacter sp.]|nr:hypothetical protein [Fibrobacter sp.]